MALEKRWPNMLTSIQAWKLDKRKQLGFLCKNGHLNSSLVVIKKSHKLDTY